MTTKVTFAELSRRLNGLDTIPLYIYRGRRDRIETFNAQRLELACTDSVFAHDNEHSSMSLKDANIIPNTYNDHAAFFCYDEAQRHLNNKQNGKPRHNGCVCCCKCCTSCR